MAYDIVHGSLKKKHLFKHRVTLVAAAGNRTLQLISTNLMLGIKEQIPGLAPTYAGPIAAGWEQIREAHPHLTGDLTLVGGLAAVPNGNWAGHIDWVVPIDSMKIEEQKAQDKIEGRDGGEQTPMQMIRIPAIINEESEFVQKVMKDPELNTELKHTKGGADMLASIINAAIRVARENP